MKMRLDIDIEQVGSLIDDDINDCSDHKDACPYKGEDVWKVVASFLERGSYSES